VEDLVGAVAVVGRRRVEQAGAANDSRLLEHLGDELAAAMTLTGRAGGRTCECGMAPTCKR
jgi:hypothetical protein